MSSQKIKVNFPYHGTLEKSDFLFKNIFNAIVEQLKDS